MVAFLKHSHCWLEPESQLSWFQQKLVAPTRRSARTELDPRPDGAWHSSVWPPLLCHWSGGHRGQHRTLRRQLEELGHSEPSDHPSLESWASSGWLCHIHTTHLFSLTSFKSLLVLKNKTLHNFSNILRCKTVLSYKVTYPTKILKSDVIITS